MRTSGARPTVVRKSFSGDGQITARIAAFSGEHGWSKAGLMFRESTAAGSPHAFIYLTPFNGVGVHARATSNGTTTNTAGPWWASAPYWLRLVRGGNTFSAYASTDGVTWSLVGTQTVAMPGTVYVGLAVSAHDVTKRATAEFTDVQLAAP